MVIVNHGSWCSKCRIDPDIALWVTEDYLLFTTIDHGMEREAVLDRYFDDISVERVGSEEEGWNMISNNSSFGIKK